MGSGLQSYQPLRSAFPGILRMVGGPMLGFRAFISSLTGVRPTDAESFAAFCSPSTLLISSSWSSNPPLYIRLMKEQPWVQYGSVQLRGAARSALTC